VCLFDHWGDFSYACFPEFTGDRYHTSNAGGERHGVLGVEPWIYIYFLAV